MTGPAAVAGPGEVASPAAPGHGRLIAMFGVVSLALLMQSIDVTIVATALHTLQRDLDASINWASWTLTVYAVGLVVALPVAATLSDRLGRRRVFVGAVALFAVASLGCGLAGDVYTLVALRALQAVGGAGFTPSATGIVVDHFGASRDRAVGLFGSVFSIGGMIGPILGGVFVAYLSWRWIFFVNVPVCAVLIALSLRLIPADPERSTRSARGLDVLGMVALGIGIVAGMIGITNIGEPGIRPGAVAAPLAVAAVALAFFARHIRRASAPIMPPRLIYGRGFGAVNVISVLYSGAVLGMISLIPLYATNRYGMGALESGTLLTAEAIAVIVLSMLSAFALRRTGYRVPLYAGAVLVAAGMVLLAIGPRGMSAYAWLALASCVIGMGAGLANPASRTAGLQLDPGQAARLAALRTMSMRIGLIAAVAIATSIVASSHNPGTSQAYVFAAFGALLLVATPVIARVPDHRGSW